MMKNVLILIIVFVIPQAIFCQKWHSYSDSIIVNIEKKDFEKASRFVELADKEINATTNLKDTIYADYIYRKGVLQGFLSGHYNLIFLKEALKIWESNHNKNHLKIMKINFFIGSEYLSLYQKSKEKKYLKFGYEYYDKSYKLIKKYSLKYPPLEHILNWLMIIEYNDKEDLDKAKKYAQEFTELKEISGVKDFDFSYTDALEYGQDLLKQERILLDYLDKYESNEIDNTDLLFKIYFKLLKNKSKFIINNLYKKYPREIINYGEKAIGIYKSNNLKVNLELEVIYSQLEIAYTEIKDNVNAKKYRKLIYENRKVKGELDFYDILDQLYLDKDYKTFKLKFDEYEDLFKREKNYVDLIEIYGYSLNLYTKGILFNNRDIEEQLTFIANKSQLLSDETIAVLDLYFAEFYITNDKFDVALTHCNSHLNDVSVKRRIKFYQFKSICENYLGYKKRAFNSAYNTLRLAKEIYGDNDPRLLRSYNSLINLSNNNYTVKLTSEVLKVIYDNELEETEIGARTWNSIAQSNLLNGNYIDAEFYYEKAKTIFKNPSIPFNPYGYINSLLGLSSSQLWQGKLQKAKENLAEVKITLDDNPHLTKLYYGDYYHELGNLYFVQDKFLKASENYRNSFSFYGAEFSLVKSLYPIISEYFLDNNISKALEGIEKYQKVNPKFIGGYLLKYLLIYQTGDLQAAKKALMESVDKQISQNEEYFQLLSSDEREAQYKSFINLFEFLNGYLQDADQTFLKQYINYRFYSKSLKLSNSINEFVISENELELYEELNVNTIQINKLLESNEVNNLKVDSLNRRNREIEKLLSFKEMSLEAPTFKDVVKKLSKEDAYVEIIRINKQVRNFNIKSKDNFSFFSDYISYGAIIIKKNTKPKFILIDDTNRLENEFVPQFKNKIISKKSDNDSYRLLFEPIERELQDVNKIYFVTDGVYNSINIESIYNPIKKQYIIDYLNIQQVQNVRSLIDQKKEYKVSESTKVSLFGNPDFNLKIENKDQIKNLLVTTLDRKVTNEIKTSIKISPLRGTQLEIDNIDTMLKEVNCTTETFSGSLASEDNLKNVNSPDILHIATHGYFLKDDENSKTKRSISSLINDDFKGNSYLKSGLLLAGAQNTLNNIDLIGANNGIINGEEVKKLNLNNTELVVLSACETGLGDNLVGQGVLGLQRAFMIAGAKSVIMSLWSISDSKTQQLMTLFYSNMIKRQMSKEKALRQAKLEMKNIYTEPYYWAGFVLLE